MRKFISLAILALLAIAAPHPAIAGEAIVNSEITVEATGKDAADARQIAMSGANAAALKDLLDKLAAPGQAESIISTIDV
jgi:hypothetical protein